MNFAKIIIGLGLVLFLIFYIEPKAIYETYKRADKLIFVSVFILLFVNLYLQFYKWKILSQQYFDINKDKTIWYSLFYGISGGIFTPMKSGEYFARALPYKKAKVLDVILATIVDKFIPIFFIIVIGGTLFLFYLRNLVGISIVTTIGFAIIFNLLIFVLLLVFFGNSTTSIKTKDWLKSISYFEKSFERGKFLKSMNKKTFVKHVMASFLYHITFTTQMALLLIAFSGQFNYLLFLFIANLIIFVQIIIPPIAFGEIGVREGAAVYFLQSFGFEGAIGFSAAMSLFFINLLIPSLIGLTLLLKKE